MKTLIAAIPLLLLLSACTAPTPTPAPASTAAAALPSSPTPRATVTVLPPTETPPAVSTLVPAGQPAMVWNGLPVMPGALAGEGDEEAYVYTIQATPGEVQEYYQRELPELGWQSLSREAEGATLTLLFVNNASETLTISILAKEEQVLVLLAK